MESLASLIAALQSEDREAAELTSRRLRKIAEADAPSLTESCRKLLQLAMSAKDLHVRWNLTIVIGKLAFSKTQHAIAVDWLFERLRDESPLTRTCALQALADLSGDDLRLRRRLAPIAQEFAENGTAAMRARARKLLKQFR